MNDINRGKKMIEINNYKCILLLNMKLFNLTTLTRKLHGVEA